VNPGLLVSKDKRDRFAEVYEPTKREPPAPDTPRGSAVAMGGKVISRAHVYFICDSPYKTNREA